MVERQLAVRGLDRHSMGRQEFLEEVGRWKEEKGGVILDQLAQLGASLDWSRTQFTLSPQFVKAVNTAFIRLMDAGLIYRGEKLVNWSPALRTALSDMEVTHVQVEGGESYEVPGWDKPVQLGVMVDIAYKLVGSEEELVVSTTRPETLLGDTGLAVHPDDERYRRWHGAAVWHPTRHCQIPVVCDPSVDMELGTGVLKITPGHDYNDWELGVRHGLEVINVMEDDGRMTNVPQEFQGLHRFQARDAVCSMLEELGLLRGRREDHSMVIPVCHRTGDILEPRLKSQWFLRTDKMAELACQAVRERDLVLDPEEYEAVWAQFLGEESHRDWCISRQIWWGHQVPAYLCSSPDQELWVAAASEEEARRKAAGQLKCEESVLTVSRDSDVLDTWFSSALYPAVVFGWPDDSADLQKFYPLNLMETGHDILFFWVGRMVMLGVALTGKLPFSEVMLHGVVSDSQGRKMSKSLGNVVDPLHLIHGASLDQLEQELTLAVQKGNISEEEGALAWAGMMGQFPEGIPAHGVDPVRWGLLSYDCKQKQINLNLNILNTAGAWCNKVWQLARFLHLAHEKVSQNNLETLPKNFQPGLMDMWILSQLASAVRNVNEAFEQKELNVVVRELRKFIYTDLCDNYVEYIKGSLKDPTSPEFLPSLLILHSCVMSSLKMLHPIMPFITEELYQRLPSLPKEKRQESIMIEKYPVATDWNGFLNESLASTIETALAVVTAARSIKKRYNLKSDTAPDLIVCADLTSCEDIIQRLGGVGNIEFSKEVIPQESLPFGFTQHVSDGLTVYMDVGKHLDIDKEITKIDTMLAKVDRDRLKVNKLLKGKFQYRKSPEVVASKHAELDEVVKQLNNQKEILEKLRLRS